MPSIRLPQFLRPLALFIPVLMLFSVVLLLRFPSWFAGSETTIYRALIADLTFSIPLVYFLIIRKREIPNITTVPVFVLGVVTASFLVPEHHQNSLDLIKDWVFPLVELSVFSFLVYKVVSLKKAFNRNKNGHFDFMEVFHGAAKEVLPAKVAGVFTTEASMFYYALFTWKKTAPTDGSYTYHKNSGVQALLAALLMAVVVETLAIHFIVAQWSHTVAWVLTLLSVYTGLQVFAYIKSIPRRPIVLTDGKLTLRNGLLGSCDIPVEAIDKIEVFSGDLPEAYEKVKKMSAFYQNVVLHLKQPVEINGLYGVRKKADVLAFYIDETASFEKEILENLN